MCKVIIFIGNCSKRKAKMLQSCLSSLHAGHAGHAELVSASVQSYCHAEPCRHAEFISASPSIQPCRHAEFISASVQITCWHSLALVLLTSVKRR